MLDIDTSILGFLIKHMRTLKTSLYSETPIERSRTNYVALTSERHAGEWIFFTASVSAISLIFFLAVLVMLISILHIPLPNDIADRRKLQFLEFILRISNEYTGNLVEHLFGAQIRTKFTRILTTLPYMFKSRPPKLTIKNEKIGNVPVRVYYPRKKLSYGCIIFIHGGGWCILKPAYYDAFITSLIKRLGIMVISIKYRLSPEYPFPAPVDDCEAVYLDLITNKYRDYQIDPNRICIMGDSAGGNLSTVIVQRQLRKKLLQPRCQVLIYPVIHAFNLKAESYQLFENHLRGTSLLSPKMMARWFLLYLNIPATSKNIKKLLNNQQIYPETRRSDQMLAIVGPSEVEWPEEKSEPKEAPAAEMCSLFAKNGFNPDFAPIMGTNLEGMCPAMIITVGYDILRDEGIQYVHKLRSFGVDVKWNHHPNGYHGVINMPSSILRRQIVEDISKFISVHL